MKNDHIRNNAKEHKDTAKDNKNQTRYNDKQLTLTKVMQKKTKTKQDVMQNKPLTLTQVMQKKTKTKQKPCKMNIKTYSENHKIKQHPINI